MIVPAVRTILAGDSAVASVAIDRIWLGVRPQNERRAGIVLTLVNGEHPHTLEEHAGYVTGTVQVDCLAPTYREARELAAKVITAIDRYSGVAASTTIDWLMVETESDVPTQPLEGAAVAPTFGVSLEVSFMHQR
jgi:hypothetical protein